MKNSPGLYVVTELSHMHIENAFSLGIPDTYKNLVVVTSCSYTANCCEWSVPLSTKNHDMHIDVNIVRIVSLNLNNVEANISINIFKAYNLTFLSLYTSSKVCANI